jgi:transcriptional regulator with XRE-family HTH domain
MTKATSARRAVDRQVSTREGPGHRLDAMGSAERTYDRGSRQGQRLVRSIGDEFRTARLALGLSQRHLALTARVSRSQYGRIELGAVQHLSILTAARISAVLGLDLSARTYPGGRPIRDTAHARRLRRLLGHVGPPLESVTDVPLRRTTVYPEQRAWDAVLSHDGRRTAVELETRLHDVQALTRHIHMKQRDDAPDELLLVVANTRANRRVVHEFGPLFADWPRLRTAGVLKRMRSGQHPGTGLILF